MRDRVRAAFVNVPVDPDVLEELVQHAESTYAELRADGLTADEANARIEVLIAGWRRDPAALSRVVRRSPAIVPPSPAPSVWSGSMADLIYGWRMLRAQPGAALITILTIALGIGAVTILSSVAGGVLLRPLPWADTDRLVQITETRGGRPGRIAGTILNGTFLAWAESPQTIEAIGSFRDTPKTLTGAGEATRLPVTWVTPSMLELLNVQPLRGRLFANDEGAPGPQPTHLILSHGLWEQRFGAREDVLGQIVLLDGRPHEIVGVMPRSFRFPSAETQGWAPWLVPEVDVPGGGKRGVIMRAVARLKPGVTAAQAAAEGTARAIAAPDAGGVGMALFGAKEPIQISVQDAREAATAEVRPAIIVLLIAAMLLFVTAIANVANMQLARASARHREMTIRAALGAGTSRLARQLLIENGLTAAIGAGAGLLLALALHASLPALLPAGFPRVDAIEIDGGVLAVTLVLAGITSVVCGVLPLLHVRRLDITRSLSDASLGSAGVGRGRLAVVRTLIVGSQVAVTCVLVIGAALLSRSFVSQMNADRGYDPTNLLTASIPFPFEYSVTQREQALSRILDRLKQRPGISHAATSTALPLASSGGFSFFTLPSPLQGGTTLEVETIRRIVSPEYFGALGIRVRAGRPLTEADREGAPLAVVVNRAFVTKYLEDVPPQRAVGLSLGPNAIRNEAKNEAIVVGVVDDLVQGSLGDGKQSEMFIASAQQRGVNLGSQSFILLRTADDPAGYIEALKTTVREENPAIALDTIMTMDERVGVSVSRARTYAVLLGGFAIFALVIAGTGLFGVLSFSVTQRARELAVRAALGASRAGVIRVALKQAGVAIVAGLVFGVALAMGLSNQLSPFIYGVSTRDWLSFGVAPVALLLMAIAACVVPARRVAQTDPVQVLREI